MLAVVFVLAACGKTREMEIGNGYNINVTGINGEGIVSSANLQSYDIVANYTTKHNLQVNMLDVARMSKGEIYKLDAVTNAEQFVSSMKLEPKEEYKNLKNGDKLKFTIVYSADMAKEYGIKLKEKEIEYTVEGLVDVKDVSLSEYITVDF